MANTWNSLPSILSSNHFLIYDQISESYNRQLKIWESFKNNLSKVVVEEEIDTTNMQSFNSKNELKQMLSKKCGRWTEKQSINSVPHTKASLDNMLRKVKVAFHNFWIQWINSYIVKLFGKDTHYFLRKVNGKFTSDVTIQFNLRLMQLSLKEFFSQKMSGRFKILDITNKELIEEMEKLNPKINKLLNWNYKTAYIDLFLADDKTEMIREFGLNDKVITFNDYWKIRNPKDKFDDNYYMELNKVGKEKFIKYFYYTRSRRIREICKANIIRNDTISLK